MKRIGVLVCLCIAVLGAGQVAARQTTPCTLDICRCIAATDEGFATLGIQYCSKLIDDEKTTSGVRMTVLVIRAKAKTLVADYDGTVADASAAIALDANGNDALAAAYYWRGDGYLLNGLYDKALADENTAISLNGDLANVFAERASVYALMGRFDLALADSDEAINRAPHSNYSYFARGLVYFMKGDMASAADDIERARKLDPSYGDAVLWLHLTHLHQGVDDGAAFAANTVAVKLDEWPGPLIKLFLGQAAIADVDAYTHSNPDRDSRLQLCDRLFTEGEWESLWRHDAAAARPLYRHFVDLCPRSTDYMLAEKALQSGP
jgi:tetratricopeptide (TPR) repeat protein